MGHDTMRCEEVVLFVGVVAAAHGGTTSLPINARYFAFSSYLGPIVNLSYSDPAVLRVSNTLGLGSLRYPGGSPAARWNYTSGRWDDTLSSTYVDRNKAFPAGTFTPDKYMEGIGKTLSAAPIWNLNLAMSNQGIKQNIAYPEDVLKQLDALKAMAVPVDYLELD